MYLIRTLYKVKDPEQRTQVNTMLKVLSEELKQSRPFEGEMRKFADIVTSNTDIQEKLSAAVDDGISREGFTTLYVTTAAEHGVTFTVDDMAVAMHEQKQGKDKVLPSVVQKLITVL